MLTTAVGLLIFLAYGTTPAVARLLSAGDRPAAIRAGIDGIWLAVVAGAALVAAMPLAKPVVAVFGAASDVTEHAAVYLGISILGLPAMLIVLAATGLMRALQDTRTPLAVATAGFAATAAPNALLIHGLRLGTAGSALGTVIAQWGMTAFFLWFAGREARRERVPLGAVIWAAFSFGYLGARAVMLGLRARSDAWLRSGRR